MYFILTVFLETETMNLNWPVVDIILKLLALYSSHKVRVESSKIDTTGPNIMFIIEVTSVTQESCRPHPFVIRGCGCKVQTVGMSTWTCPVLNCSIALAKSFTRTVERPVDSL